MGHPFIPDGPNSRYCVCGAWWSMPIHNGQGPSAYPEGRAPVVPDSHQAAPAESSLPLDSAEVLRRLEKYWTELHVIDWGKGFDIGRPDVRQQAREWVIKFLTDLGIILDDDLTSNEELLYNRGREGSSE